MLSCCAVTYHAMLYHVMSCHAMPCCVVSFESWFKHCGLHCRLSGAQRQQLCTNIGRAAEETGDLLAEVTPPCLNPPPQPPPHFARRLPVFFNLPDACKPWDCLPGTVYQHLLAYLAVQLHDLALLIGMF